MELSNISGWLPDVNVWLALCSDRHQHHHAAADWLDGVQKPIHFCRITQMSLLRLLTSAIVMGEDRLSPKNAIVVYRDLTADDRIHFASEPANTEAI